MKHKKFALVLVFITLVLIAIPFAVSAIQNIFVESDKVTDIQIGDVPVNYVYVGDELVWERCVVPENQEYNYGYTGGYQTFIAPCTGVYQFQLWGAQGGNISTYAGGKGGYSKASIYLGKNEKLYIYVGSMPVATALEGGYNGGGSINSGQQIYGASGGGHTDVRLSLDPRSGIMVAGGGGGANKRGAGYGEGDGGDGGSLLGGNGKTQGGTGGYGSGGQSNYWRVLL